MPNTLKLKTKIETMYSMVNQTKENHANMYKNSDAVALKI